MEEYEILEQIGKGSFGSAFLVRHKHENKKYVLKKIRLARQSDRNRRSAHQERELISRAQNPFIVEYKDSWVERGCYVCIVLGYCEGGDMAAAIKRANGIHFPEEKLCKWLVQLLMALDYLHTNHILHRDVKCSNIFLTKDKDIRLGDFGLAKMLTSDDLTSSVVGTPSYMCPELLADIPYGSKSDIWSLGCCIYEMAAHTHAFKAIDMQALINKINKSIVAPLPTIYSGAFRGLVKSMLRKNPELRPNAADLLGHPHLQTYVLKIHLKLNSPRRNSYPAGWTDCKYINKTSEAEGNPIFYERDKRHLFRNDQPLNPSMSGTEEESFCSTQRGFESPSHLNQKLARLSFGIVHDKIGTEKPNGKRFSSVARTPKRTPSKLPESPIPARRSSNQTRRVSLPLTSRTAALRTPYKSNVGLFHSVESSDISVNAPQIDKVAEFPSASSEDALHPLRRMSSSSVQCSSAPDNAEHTITKDKCTIQILDRVVTRPNFNDASHGAMRNGNKRSEHKPTTVISGHSSSESRQRRFDTSSHQQRAEALEGLLEFSAVLLQQERFEELGVLLKPFGPEKVSPRETAIWLAKSIKGTACS